LGAPVVARIGDGLARFDLSFSDLHYTAPFPAQFLFTDSSGLVSDILSFGQVPAPIYLIYVHSLRFLFVFLALSIGSPKRTYGHVHSPVTLSCPFRPESARWPLSCPLSSQFLFITAHTCVPATVCVILDFFVFYNNQHRPHTSATSRRHFVLFSLCHFLLNGVKCCIDFNSFLPRALAYPLLTLASLDIEIVELHPA